MPFDMEEIFTGIETFLESVKVYVKKVIDDKKCDDIEYFATVVAKHRLIGDELCNFWDANFKDFHIDDVSYKRKPIIDWRSLALSMEIFTI